MLGSDVPHGLAVCYSVFAPLRDGLSSGGAWLRFENRRLFRAVNFLLAAWLPFCSLAAVSRSFFVPRIFYHAGSVSQPTRGKGLVGTRCEPNHGWPRFLGSAILSSPLFRESRWLNRAISVFTRSFCCDEILSFFNAPATARNAKGGRHVAV